MGVGEESIEARCARYRAERDLARQDADWLRAKIDECVARGMGGEDAEAARWVREHGGLEHLKNNLSALELLAEGIEIDTGRVFYDESPKERCVALRNEVRSRLMPSGMEWPRFEDGSLVEIGDEVVGPDYGERIHVYEVTFHANGFTLREQTGLDKWYESDDRFKRPAPKVLDADMYDAEDGMCMRDPEHAGRGWHARPDGFCAWGEEPES